MECSMWLLWRMDFLAKFAREQLWKSTAISTGAGEAQIWNSCFKDNTKKWTIPFALLWAFPYLLSTATPLLHHLRTLAACFNLSNVLRHHPFPSKLLTGQLPQVGGWFPWVSGSLSFLSVQMGKGPVLPCLLFPRCWVSGQHWELQMPGEGAALSVGLSRQVEWGWVPFFFQPGLSNASGATTLARWYLPWNFGVI